MIELDKELKQLKDDGFNYIARDADESGGRVWAFESKPTRVVNSLDSIWSKDKDTKMKELRLDGFKKLFNWNDDPSLIPEMRGIYE